MSECLVNVAVVYSDDLSGNGAAKADHNVSQSEDAEPDEKDCLSIEVARDRARVMHDIYAATLDVLHHRYFHRDRSIIPARHQPATS